MPVSIYVLEKEEVLDQLKGFSLADRVESNPIDVKAMIEENSGSLLSEPRSAFEKALNLWINNEIQEYDRLHGLSYIHLNEKDVKVLIHDLESIDNSQSEPYDVMPIPFEGETVVHYDNLYFGDVNIFHNKLKAIDFSKHVLVYGSMVI